MGDSAPDAVLIDGYNVLHAIPQFAPRGADLASARERFESWLSQAAGRAGVERCVLVWDGRGGRREHRVGRLTILYTAAGVSADDRLLDLCRGEFASRSASTWVVSSDRDVQDPARQLGFTVLGALAFYRRWSFDRVERESTSAKGDRTGDAENDPGGAARLRSSRAEVDELLDAFLNADRERG
ncbi:MAG TPA: NYN domain-containing protein [Gemmatimonadota bacterium]|nr:NYN domain-containing protein [Gemmatimonadota bacterium]